MSQLNQILEYLSSVQTGYAVSGLGTIKMGYPYQPQDPPSANCPFVVNEVRGGPTDFMAVRGFQRVVDKIAMVLCVARYESDATLAANVKFTAQWRDAMFSLMASHLRFGNSFSFVTVAYIERWDAMQKIAYGTAEFIGMTFYLHVEEQFLLTVAP